MGKLLHFPVERSLYASPQDRHKQEFFDRIDDINHAYETSTTAAELDLLLGPVIPAAEVISLAAELNGVAPRYVNEKLSNLLRKYV